MLGLIGPIEHVSFAFGLVIMAVTVPLVLPVIFGAVVWEWEAVDRGFHGGFVESGKELTGFLVGKVAPAFNRATQSFNAQVNRAFMLTRSRMQTRSPGLRTTVPNHHSAIRSLCSLSSVVRTHT